MNAFTIPFSEYSDVENIMTPVEKINVANLTVYGTNGHYKFPNLPILKPFNIMRVYIISNSYGLISPIDLYIAKSSNNNLVSLYTNPNNAHSTILLGVNNNWQLDIRGQCTNSNAFLDLFFAITFNFNM